MAAFNNEDNAGVDEDPNGGNHYSGDVDWILHDFKEDESLISSVQLFYRHLFGFYFDWDEIQDKMNVLTNTPLI